VYEILFYLLKRALPTLGTLILIINVSEAQESRKIDSLNSLIQTKSGIDKYDDLIQIVIEYASFDNDKALSYADQAKTVALQAGDTARIVKASRIIGQLLNRINSKEAIDIHLKTLPIAKRNNLRNDYKIMLNGLAYAYTIQAEYDKALEIHLQSLILREEDGDKTEISISLNNIGLVYFKLKNYEKALEYYSRSLKLKLGSNDTYDLDRLYINIGLCHIHLSDFNEALKSINLGFKTCSDNCADAIKIEGEFGLGVAYFGLMNYEESEQHHTTSLDLARKNGNHRFQAENLVYLSKIAIAIEDNSKAKEFLSEAESLADSAGYNQLLIDTYKQFSVLYNQTKDFENASMYQNKYIHLKDSLIGEDLVKNVAKIQTNFEERVNIATIADREEALARQRTLNISLGIIAVLIGLLGFVLYRSNVVTRRVNSALSDAKGIIETQNLRLQNINRELDGKVKEKTADLLKANAELDTANQSLSRVNDELDNFIYKTSHDIRGPLASLKGICSVALMDVKDQLALDYLKKLDVSSGRLNVILTRLLIVNQINNAIVAHESIDFQSIIDDVILLEKKKGLPPRFEIRNDIQTDIILHSDKDLVRIILENLIDNAIKFYNDSERVQPFVHIKIGADHGKGVVVSVVDNGIGIAEAKPDKIFQMFSRASERSGTGGIGLYLSKLATEKLGGEIHLRTTPDGYTEFYVYFPMKAVMA
jgi:signal transduction histidine kinase